MTENSKITTVEPMKNKYHGLYKAFSESAAQQSYAVRRKVGCCIVTRTGLTAVGWNGMPAGLGNVCEWQVWDGGNNVVGTTKPMVIHAERNALDKLTRQGISPEGSLLFVTTAPCIECAKSIHAVGVKEVYYRDDYHDTAGPDFLKSVGIPVYKYEGDYDGTI